LPSSTLHNNLSFKSAKIVPLQLTPAPPNNFHAVILTKAAQLVFEQFKHAHVGSRHASP
jgi:hypothetical protein